MKKEQNKLNNAWKNFEKTGSVMDYLDYAYLKRDLFADHREDDR